jgi:excisionase family DNA binding protein
MNIEELLSIPQAADRIGISRASLYYAIDQGKLDVVEVGGRKMLVKRQVEQYQPAGYKDRRPSKRKEFSAMADQIVKGRNAAPQSVHEGSAEAYILSAASEADQDEDRSMPPISPLPPKTALTGQEWDRAFEEWLDNGEPTAANLLPEMLRRKHLYQDAE